MTNSFSDQKIDLSMIIAYNLYQFCGSFYQ